MFRLRNFTAAGLIGLCGAMASAGCVDNDSSLFVSGVFDLSSTRCIAEADTNNVLLSHGIIDVAFARGYTAALLIGSQLTERGSREKLRTETSRLAVEGTRVTLYGTAGGEASFETSANGVIHPASGTDPGLGTVFAQLIRAEDLGDPTVQGDYGALGPPGEAVVRLRVFGTTLGGQEIESGDFDFSIIVCEGCLVTYPPEAADPDPNLDDYYCSFAADVAPAETEYCFLGQDQPIPCTACVSFSDVCETPLNNPAYNPAL